MNYKYDEIVKNLEDNKYCYYKDSSNSGEQIIIFIPNNNICVIIFDKNKNFECIKFIKNNNEEYEKYINIIKFTKINEKNIKSNLIGLISKEIDNSYNNINAKNKKEYNLSSIEYTKQYFIPEKKVCAKYIVYQYKSQSIFIKLNNGFIKIDYDENYNLTSVSIYRKEFNNINKLFSNINDLTKISICSDICLSEEELSFILNELFF